MRYLAKIHNNDTYYVEHREGTNAFRIRKDRKQDEKDKTIKVMEANGSNNEKRYELIKNFKVEAT